MEETNRLGGSRLERLINNRSLLIVMALLAVFCVVVYGDMMLGDGYFMYGDVAGDSFNEFYPHASMLSDKVRDGDVSAWSFESGLGRQVYTIGTNYLLEMFLPSSAMPYGFVWLMIFKVLMTGFLGHQLFKELGLSPLSRIIGAIALATCAHMVVRGQWYHYATEVMLSAFALYAFELLYRKKNGWLFSLAFALLLVNHAIAYLYIYSLLGLVYAAIRYLIDNPFKFKALFFYLLKLAPRYLLALGLAAIVLLPGLYAFFNSSRSSIGLRLNKVLSLYPPETIATSYARAFNPDILGGKLGDFTGSGNYLESAAFYCSILALLVATQVRKLREKRHRRIAMGLLAAIALYMVWPFVPLLITAFSHSSFKLSSFWISVALIMITAFMLDKHERGELALGRISPFVSGALFGALLLVVHFVCMPMRKPELAFVAGLLVINACALFLYAGGLPRLRIGPAVRRAALILVVFVEVTATAFSTTISERDIITQGKLDSRLPPAQSEAIAELKREDKSFYRVAKRTQAFYNDAELQHYYGLSYYYSMNTRLMVDFYRAFSLNDPKYPPGNYLSQFNDVFAINTLLGVRYYISNSDGMTAAMAKNAGYAPAYYEEYKTFGDYAVYMNKHALPLGFTYDHYLMRKDFNALNKDARRTSVLSAVVVDEGPRRLAKVDRATLAKDDAGALKALSETRESGEELRVSEFRDGHVKGELSLTRSQFLFLSIPYDEGWELKVDGHRVELQPANIAFMGAVIEEGEHEIELTYSMPYFRLGLAVTLVSLLLLCYLVVRQHIPYIPKIHRKD